MIYVDSWAEVQYGVAARVKENNTPIWLLMPVPASVMHFLLLTGVQLVNEIYECRLSPMLTTRTADTCMPAVAATDLFQMDQYHIGIV